MRNIFKIIYIKIKLVALVSFIAGCTDAQIYNSLDEEYSVIQEYAPNHFEAEFHGVEVSTPEKDYLHIPTLQSEFGELDYHIIGREVHYVESLQMYFRTFYFISHGFSFLLSTDHTIDFNPGGWRGNYVWVLGAESILALEEGEAGIIMWLGNMRIHSAESIPDRTQDASATHVELVTNQGKTGYYIFHADRFEFILDHLDDYFIFIANFSEEDLELFKPLLLYMATSFRIL